MGDGVIGGRLSPSLRLPVSISHRVARRGALIWGLFLFVLTSWPSPPEVPVLSGISNFDKFVHMTLYAIEAFLIYRAVAWPGRERASVTRVLAIVGAMAVWAVADETHQSWIPGRSMETGDVAADLAGAVLGAAIASAVSSMSSFRSITLRSSGDEGSGPVSKSRDPSLRSG